MKKENIKLLRKLYELEKQADRYIDSIPTDINAAIFDNGYTEVLGRQNDLLMMSVFGDDVEEAFWCLIEFKDGCQVFQDDKELVMKNIEEYFAWLETNAST